MIFDYLNCIFGMIKILLYKILYFNRISFKNIPKMNASFKIAIKKGSTLKIGKNFRTRNNISFRAYDNSKIEIGDNCFFNDGCSLNGRKKIKIGNDFKAGQNVMIYDNDHDYKKDINQYITSDVIIGDNVWIGANTIILKGVTIGNNVVVAAGSIVRHDIDDNTVFYNQRTEKTIKRNNESRL